MESRAESKEAVNDDQAGEWERVLLRQVGLLALVEVWLGGELLDLVLYSVDRLSER